MTFEDAGRRAVDDDDFGHRKLREVAPESAISLSSTALRRMGST